MSSVKKPRLLIIDDDVTFLSALKKVLQNNFEVIAEDKPESAKHIFAVESFDAVLSDIRLPGMSGIELLHYIKKTKPVPVILMTGFAELKETKEANELGADGFIAKPFRPEELKAELARCLPANSETKQSETKDEDFSELSIDDFISGKEIKFDIYIRLGQNRFVKIAHQGEDLAPGRIQSYKEKNISHLHLKKEDFRTYVGFNIRLTTLARSSDKIDKEKKLYLLASTSKLFSEQIYKEGLDEQAFFGAKNMVENTIQIVTDQEDLSKLLATLNDRKDFLYVHSVAVSAYSVMLAKSLGWNSRPILFKVALGGLLHDVGKKEIPLDVLLKSRKNLNEDEIRLIESHPVRGFEILSSIKEIPSDVLQITQQHHEQCTGAGYPAGLNKMRIHPLARLVSIANEFCHLVLPTSGEGAKTPQEAIQYLSLHFAERLDTEYLHAFEKLVPSIAPL